MRLYYVIIVFLVLLATGLLFFNSSEKLLENSIASGDWETVQKLLENNPELANATVKQHAKARGQYQISAVCYALKNRQPEIAKLLLSAGADPTKNTDDRNPLCYAAYEGYTDLIPLLVKKGVDPNIEDQKTFGQPHLPLSLVKDIKTTQVLLENGADVNARTGNGETPLHGFASLRDIGVAALFVEQGADVNAKDTRGCTPLHKASWECLPENVRLLIDNGADVNALDNKGRNALKRTVEERTDSRGGLERASFHETLQLLISSGCDADVGEIVFAGDIERLKERLKSNPELIHTYRFRREPLLIIAIYEGHSDIVEYLIEKGADVHATGNSEDPALHLAAFAGNPETVKLLLKAGLNVNQMGVHGELPLHWVSRLPDSGRYQRQCNYERVARILIDAGSDLNARARQAGIDFGNVVVGEKPIDQVSRYLRNLKVRKYTTLVRRYTTIGIQSIMFPPLAFDVGDTPLHSAARWGRIEILNLLIEAGAQIDPKNALNQTPLHYAVVYQHTDVVKTLLTADADPKLKTNKEMDAFQLAEKIDEPAIISLLSDFGT